MVNHIVMWNFVPEMKEAERAAVVEKIRGSLEALKDVVEGVVSIEVIGNELASSNRDLGMISKFESVEALNNYQVHPKHLEAAGYIRSVTCDRVCLDYEEK